MSEDDIQQIGRAVIDYKEAHEQWACAHLRAKRMCDQWVESAELVGHALEGKDVETNRANTDVRDLVALIERTEQRRTELLSRLAELGIPLPNG